jgi:tetratricopeptide (TPR) repeat protein
MKERITHLCIFLLILLSLPSYAQDRAVDSLTVLLKNETTDTGRAILMGSLAEMIEDDSTWRFYNGQALSIAEINIPTAKGTELKCFLRIKATALNNLGYGETTKGNLSSALEYYNRSLALEREIGNKKDEAFILNNIADIFETQGNIATALKYYQESLRMHEQAKNKQGIAQAYNNLGFIYSTQDDLDKALDYYQKSYKLKKELQDRSGMAVSLGNIGFIYSQRKMPYQAMSYYLLALKLAQEINDKERMGLQYSNIGDVLQLQGNDEEALKNYLTGLQLCRETGDAEGISHYLCNIGTLYFKKNDPDKALSYGNESMNYAMKVGSPKFIRATAELLKNIYKAKGNSTKALEYFELYHKMNDSISSAETKKATYRQQLSYEYDKKETLAKAEQEKKDVENASAIKRQRIVSWSIGLGLLMVIVFSVSLYKRFLLTQKQHRIIEEQKHIVDEKNSEILASINYAKRLQDAILPPLKMVRQHLPDSFVLFRPKDIVAGDFYWMEVIQSENRKNEKLENGLILLAAADCTGHGVPGAMVSVVWSNALNRTVKEFGITAPGEILDKTRELVVETFEKSESEVKDGMDISLCSFSGNELRWAGANNPLWIIEAGKEEITEYKPTKQPIGKSDQPSPFSELSIQLKKGDLVYIFTDGYADQFGLSAEAWAKAEGITRDPSSSLEQINSAKATLIKGKKFKYAQLKEVLLSIRHLSMTEQSARLDQTLREWRGNLEQVDDILIIGVRI